MSNEPEISEAPEDRVARYAATLAATLDVLALSLTRPGRRAKSQRAILAGYYVAALYRLADRPILTDVSKRRLLLAARFAEEIIGVHGLGPRAALGVRITRRLRALFPSPRLVRARRRRFDPSALANVLLADLRVLSENIASLPLPTPGAISAPVPVAGARPSPTTTNGTIQSEELGP